MNLLNEDILFKNEFLSITFGSMCSMKTITSIISVNTLSDIGLRCLYINHSYDERDTAGRSNEGNINTHHSSPPNLSKNVHCIKTDNLSSIDVSNFDFIQIDEGQFFNDIFFTVRYWVDTLKKKVSISALDGDSNRDIFNIQLMMLIPYANVVRKSKGSCQICKSNYSYFSTRLTDSKEKIVVGGTDIYRTTCRDCYLETRPLDDNVTLKERMISQLEALITELKK